MHEPRTPDSSGDQPASAQDSRQLVSCFWCERNHFGKHPLSLCSTCEASYSTLRLLNMKGSYPLSDTAIDEVLTRTSPGNFALGYMDGDSFSVFFVGRSDSDVKECLHDWVGMPSPSTRFSSNAKAPWAVHQRGSVPLNAPLFGCVGNVDTRYTHFAYSYSNSSSAAFEKERCNFEDFGGCGTLDNQTEPASMAG
jgi:hypothetical protein